jgi:hypothetical protein
MNEMRSPTGWRMVTVGHASDVLASNAYAECIEFTYEDPDFWAPDAGWSEDQEACRRKIAELFGQ